MAIILVGGVLSFREEEAPGTLMHQDTTQTIGQLGVDTEMIGLLGVTTPMCAVLTPVLIAWQAAPEMDRISI